MTLSYQFDLFLIQTWYILNYWMIEKLNENVRSSHGPASTSFSMASSFHLVWMSCLNLISTSKYSSSKILTIKFYLYTFICTRKEPRRISTFCWHPIIMLIKLEKNPSSIHKWIFICSMLNAFHKYTFYTFSWYSQSGSPGGRYTLCPWSQSGSFGGLYIDLLWRDLSCRFWVWISVPSGGGRYCFVCKPWWGW